MKKTAFYFLLTAIAMMFVACEKGDDSDPVVTNPPVVNPPETPKVYDFWYFTPSTTESDTSKWNQIDNDVYSKIAAGLNSNLMLNYTFDNSIDNEANSGITSKLDTTASGEPFIRVDKTPKLCFKKNFTLSAWVYVVHDGTNEQTIFSKINSDGNYGYKLSYNNDEITFEIKGNRQVPVVADDLAMVSCIVDKNVWRLVTAVCENDTVKLYINDSRKTPTGGIRYDIATNINIPIPTPDYNLYIGNSVNGNTPFKGSLDQVMVFNKALTSDEVSSLYDAQK